MQVSAISEELLKTEYDAVRIIYNRFYSAISFKPTIATVLRRARWAASRVPKRATLSMHDCLAFALQAGR